MNKKKKFLHYFVYIFTAISFCCSVFFFVKMEEENSLLDDFISQTLAHKNLTNLEDTVLTISEAIYNQTNGWVNREEMDWYSRWEATGFFKMSTGVGLKYKCFGVTGHPGDGPCGTMTKIFLRVMWDLEIPARKLQLREVIPGKGGHTMAEFFNGKKWCVISPSDSSFVWRNKNGEIASVKEIQSDTSIFNQVYYKWKPDWPYGFKETWNINWEKIPSPLRSTIRFFIGEEAYRNAETPKLYEKPREIIFIIFLLLTITLIFVSVYLNLHNKFIKIVNNSNLFNTLHKNLTNFKSFKVFSLIFIIYNVTGNVFLYSPGSVDYWEHLASINSFSDNPLKPSNPYLLSTQPTHLHTPYHFFWGLLSKISGIHVIFLTPLIASINSFLFLFSVYLFSNRFLGDKKYSFYLSLTMLTFWIFPWGYSGVYNLSLLPLTITYPYWFTFPIALIIISFYGENDSIASSSTLIKDFIYILLIAIIFLSHPLTGSFLVLSLIVKVYLKNYNSFQTKIYYLLLPFFGIILSFFWQYFPVLDAIFNSPSYADKGFADTWELFYKFAVIRIFPSLIGIYFIFNIMFSKKRLDFLSTSLIIFLIIYTLNYIFLHNTVFSRFVIYIAFFGHVGIVLAIKIYDNSTIFNKTVYIYILAVVIMGLPQLSKSILRFGPVKSLLENQSSLTNIDLHNNYSVINKYLSKGDDVILAPLRESWILPSITGCKVVGVLHSNPFMNDYFDRITDNNKFFQAETTVMVKEEILRKYKVKFILVPSEYFDILLPIVQNFKQLIKKDKYSFYQVN